MSKTIFAALAFILLNSAFIFAQNAVPTPQAMSAPNLETILSEAQKQSEAYRESFRNLLAEETGYTSKNFVYLGKSAPNPALQNNQIHHFLALNCRKTLETNFDEHESLVTKLAALPEIEKMIENEIITHSLVLAAFYRFEQYQKLQQYF